MEAGTNDKAIEWIKDWLLIVPAVHITLCYTYVVLYNLYFGEGLEDFSGPSDLFAVSIGSIAPTYLILFFGGLMGRGYAGLLVNFIDKGLKSSPDTGRRWDGLSRWQKLPLIGVFTAGLLFWLNIGIISLAIFLVSGRMPFEFLVSFIFLPAALLAEIKFKSVVGKSQAYLAGTALLCLISVSAAALSNAQRDKYSGFQSIVGGSPHCGDYVVLNTRGEYLLAVDPENKRYLLQKDCSATITLNYQFKELEYVSGAEALSTLWEGLN